MIDSIDKTVLFSMVNQFRVYIIQNYGSASNTAHSYLQIADRFQRYIEENEDTILPNEILIQFYEKVVGVPAFMPPGSKSKERYARAIRMMLDIFYKGNPERRYISNPVKCPEPYQEIFNRYIILMQDGQKSRGTIRTRSGRIKVFFIFLEKKGCNKLEDITPEIFIAFMAWLQEKYSSQGRASILYTIRNFFSFSEYSEKLAFDPISFLTGIHSKKHERLPSFYTIEEVRRVLGAVDRRTAWGKTAYLMMLLACVYGLRSSDIKALRLDCIKWAQRTITVTQYKTHKEVSLPLTDEVLFALLDYIKNARPAVDCPNVFIRLKRPYVPYSMDDHFGDKIVPFFQKAGVSMEGKHHGLHALRHSLATNLLETGTPVNEIANILGHSSAASTKAYVWSDLEHLRVAALEVPGND